MMTPQTKNPATVAAGQGPGQNIQPPNNNTSAPPRKWQRVLSAFLTGRSFNRFEAERELHDHALHSTVSRLQSLGLVIDRTMEAVPGYMDCVTHVCRYRLSPVSFDTAKALLGIKDEVLPC